MLQLNLLFLQKLVEKLFFLGENVSRCNKSVILGKNNRILSMASFLSKI